MFACWRRVSTGLPPRKQASEHDAKKHEPFLDGIVLYFLDVDAIPILIAWLKIIRF